MHNHQPDAEAVQEVQVVHDAQKRVVGDDLSAKRNHEGLAAEGMNVGRGRAYPLHECPRGGGMGWGIDAWGSGHRESGRPEGGCDYNVRLGSGAQAAARVRSRRVIAYNYTFIACSLPSDGDS